MTHHTLLERLQRRSDRLSTYAKAIGQAHQMLADLHRVFGEELAELGSDLAQLEATTAEPDPQPAPPRQPHRSARADTPPKACVVCGDTFERRDTESAADYDRRKTCGKAACRREAISRATTGKKKTSRRPAQAQVTAPAGPKTPAEPPPAPAAEAPAPDPAPPRAPGAETAAEPQPPAPQAAPPAEPRRLNWRPPEPHEPIRLQPLGEPCPNHPGEAIGAYGCPACRAGENWRKRGQVAYVGVGSRP